MSEDITGTGGHDRHLIYAYDAADQIARGVPGRGYRDELARY